MNAFEVTPSHSAIGLEVTNDGFDTVATFEPTLLGVANTALLPSDDNTRLLDTMTAIASIHITGLRRFLGENTHLL